MQKGSRLSWAAWMAAAPVFLLAVTLAPGGGAASETQNARFEDLSPMVIYAELKERGVDAVLGAPQEVRRAYAQYDTVFGNGHNLNTGTADAAKSATALNNALSQLNLASDVQVRTANPGARIRYRLVGADQIGALPQLSNSAEDNLAIGIYLIWAERANAQTSVPIPFRIVKPRITVDLEEKAQ
jgi:hypothetical protein